MRPGDILIPANRFLDYRFMLVTNKKPIQTESICLESCAKIAISNHRIHEFYVTIEEELDHV